MGNVGFTKPMGLSTGGKNRKSKPKLAKLLPLVGLINANLAEKQKAIVAAQRDLAKVPPK